MSYYPNHFSFINPSIYLFIIKGLITLYCPSGDIITLPLRRYYNLAPQEICESCQYSARAGNYDPAEEEMCGQKAKVLYNCYIESLIPPKVQVCMVI